jgi:hypothetical protein
MPPSDYLSQPLRSLEQYLDQLNDELADDELVPPGSWRALWLVQQIRMVEDEIEARSGT